MPYIKKEERPTLLLKMVCELPGLDLSPGQLNFIISTIIWRIFKKKDDYETANMLLGVLEAVKQEFYRRQVAVLENDKIEENGDLN